MRLTALILACLLATACTQGTRPGVTTLVYASPYAPSHPFSVADRAWIDWVEQHSGGTLRIRAIWSGALLSSDQSMLELRHGVADIGLITPIYSRGGVQLLRTQTGFYSGAKTFEQQVALYHCLAAAFPEIDHELSGLHVLAIQGGSLPGLLTRTRPVLTLEDLHWLRIRAPTELLGVLRDLGADPVDMPMGEVYSALAKGVLDGVVAPPDTLKSLHFAEVAKYFSKLEIPRGAYPARAMGERRWQALTPRDRAILEASSSVWQAAIARQTQAAVAAGAVFGQDHGVQFFPIAAVEQQRFNALYDRDGQNNARALSSYGIDGMAVFSYARRLAVGIEETGHCTCSSGTGTYENKAL